MNQFELKFEYKQTENLYTCYQQEGINKYLKIANIKYENGFINIRFTNAYKRFIKQQKFTEVDLQNINDIIENNFEIWYLEQSPLRMLTPCEVELFQKINKRINVILTSLQDNLSEMKFIEKIDIFRDTTNDFKQVLHDVKKINYRLYELSGLDTTVEVGDIADDVNELLKNKI